MADNAIKQHKFVIQDAFCFFSWDESRELSRKIFQEFISSEDEALCLEKTKSVKPLTVYGTMKHQVVVGSGGIKYHNMSCYCSSYFINVILTYNSNG